jgi:galactoside O-acetyltransferase
VVFENKCKNIYKKNEGIMFFKLRKMLKKHSFNKMLKKAMPYLDIDKSVVLYNTTNFSFLVPRKDGIAVKIGEKSIVECKFTFESDDGEIIIGHNTFIGNSNLISRNKIEIGNNVLISWNCYIQDHNSHSLDWQDRAQELNVVYPVYTDIMRNGIGNIYLNRNLEKVKSAPIKICDKAWIGFNSIILKGVTIGEGAVVGAGSVVVKDVPPWSVVAGNPAKVVKEIEH